ncbi:MAG: hypothetical protein JWO57_1866 [Pseudonocardiales bacterium]|nr:hypothetical protein [Pseudonocardiales bacterium]
MGTKTMVSHSYVFVATVLVFATGVSCSVVHHRHRPQPAVGRAATGPIEQAETWAKANLAPGTRVGVDFAFPDALGRNRPVALDVLSLGGADWRADAFVLSTAELRDEAGSIDSVSAALASSLPVAVFGSGAARVELREIATDGAAALTDRWRHDLAARTSAGIGLLRNPRVEATTSSQAALRHGGLDLRAATVIAWLAAKTPVRITDVAIDGAEAAAGRPARRMTISIADATIALSAELAALPPDYRPASVTPLPRGLLRLWWTVATAPVVSLD